VDPTGRAGPGRLSDGSGPGSTPSSRSSGPRLVDPAGAPGAAGLLSRCRFPDPGTEVVCAVSGGADSLALLALAVAAGCRPTAVHVDHGLRDGSAAEADRVADAALSLGVTFRAERVDLVDGPNLEARARTARHRAVGPDALWGHTADDQAETIVLNLMRGAGLSGLAGIRADRRHPILALRRAETTALCAALGLVPVRDPSNHDPRFRRNRVRAELLPLLDDVARRDVVEVIARQAGVLREIDDLLEDLAAALDPTDAAALAGAPAPVARVAVRRWLRRDQPDGHPPDAATVERVLAVARLEARATDVGGGRRVVRSGGRLGLRGPG
jgi:tRNA(Ile)-lysidine synthase